MRGAQLRRHPDQFPDVTDLRLAHFGRGTTEIVVGGDRMDLNSLAGGEALELTAAFRWPIERVAVRPLSVDLNAIVAETFGGFDEFRQGQGFTVVPDAEVSNAVESEFHR